MLCIKLEHKTLNLSHNCCFSLWDMGFGITCLIILMLMKKLKEVVDARMKSSSGAKKALFKLIWLICTGKYAAINLV